MFAVAEQGVHHLRGAAFGIDAQHRLGAGGADQQPGVVGMMYLTPSMLADLGDVLAADLGGRLA